MGDHGQAPDPARLDIWGCPIEGMSVLEDDEPVRTWDDAVADIPAELREDADHLVRAMTVFGGPGVAALSRLLARLAEPCPCPRRTTGGPIDGRRVPANNWYRGDSAGPVQSGWGGE